MYSFVGYVFEIYSWMIIGYILMSWVPQMRDTPIGENLGKAVEPYLRIFRKFIPNLGMIDISPIVALFALRFIEQGVYVLISLIGV